MLEVVEMDFEIEEIDQVQEEAGELQVPAEFFVNFSADLQALVVGQIDKFFADKEMYYGGPIPKKLLHNPSYITMVLNTGVDIGIPRAYEALKDCKFDRDVSEGLVPDDVRFVISILKMASRSGVPKAFSTGLMLMYLDLCEGVKI